MNSTICTYIGIVVSASALVLCIWLIIATYRLTKKATKKNWNQCIWPTRLPIKNY